MTKLSDIEPVQAHITFKAVTTVETEQGEFEAVISTATVDREKDIVEPEGFVKALQRWNELGKKLPLAWNHSRNPNEIIGHIDPATVRAVGDEVVAKGWVDYKTDVGKDVWRLVKSGTLGFSFGYIVTEATERKGGGLHITGLDVFEVTATSTPMNGDTRVLGWKSLQELRADSERLEREIRDADLPDDIPKEAAELKFEPVPMAELLENIKSLNQAQREKIREFVQPPEPPDPEVLKAKSRRFEQELGEVTLESVPEEIRTVEPPEDPNVQILKELQEVKSQLDETKSELADLKKKAEESKGSETRSVDPLRKRSEELALEVATGDLSLRTPPMVKATEPEIDYDGLKRQSRDWMFDVLSYQTE